MKKTTRILALLLALMMSFSMLVACGGGEGGGGGIGPGGDEPIISTEHDPKIEAKDYEGHEFTFITQQSADYGYNVQYLVTSEEEKGDALKDAIGKRNAILEEKYNITIAQYDVPNLLNEVRTQVMGGVTTFDVVLANARTMATLSREGLLYNLYDIPVINLEKPYWDQRANADLKTGDKLYFTNCDLNIHTIGSAIFFNKKLIKDFELTTPYTFMEQDKWTVDNWVTLAKAISRDVNNDGNMTEFDQYSNLSSHGVDSYFIFGSGIRFTVSDAEGYPQVALVENSDKLVNVYEKTKSVFGDSSVNYCISCSNVSDNGYSSKWEYLRTLFCQDLYLFDYTSDDALKIYKDMESEFGIVPFPKYDENQATYHTIYPEDFNCFGIPSVVEDLERTGKIVEDLNYYSSTILIPVWFETLLTRRLTRDDESEATLRFIKDNRVYDLGYIFDFGQFKSGVLWQKSSTINIMREYQRRKGAIDADIKVTFKDFAKMG